MKAIGKRYNQVEEQLPRAARYVKSEENADGKTVSHAWFNAVGDLLKVATEHTGPQGKELRRANRRQPLPWPLSPNRRKVRRISRRRR